jgi:hypothetical protein
MPAGSKRRSAAPRYRVAADRSLAPSCAQEPPWSASVSALHAQTPRRRCVLRLEGSLEVERLARAVSRQRPRLATCTLPAQPSATGCRAGHRDRKSTMPMLANVCQTDRRRESGVAPRRIPASLAAPAHRYDTSSQAPPSSVPSSIGRRRAISDGLWCSVLVLEAAMLPMAARTIATFGGCSAAGARDLLK